MPVHNLVRFSSILAVYALHYHTFTPPNEPKSSEVIPTQSPAERWLKFGRQYNYLVTGIHLLLGVAEISTIYYASDDFYINNTSLLGLLILTSGTYLRYMCFKTMAHNFAFSLSIRENHELITHGPYSVVRHPAYSGLTLVYIGLGLWHGAQGSWVRQSGILQSGLGTAVLVAYSIYMIGCLVCLLGYRIPSEDRELRKVFGEKWDEWAKKVPYVVIPGVL